VSLGKVELPHLTSPVGKDGDAVISAERVHSKRPRVVIGDGQALVRYAFKILVTEVLGDACFFEAQNFDSLLPALQQEPPARLALIDIKMPGMLGGYRLHDLARRYPTLPLLLVSTPITALATRRILNIGSVHGFVPKTASTEHLRSAIEAALRGEKFSIVHARHGMRSTVALTPRQEEIRDLLRQGMTNKVIARTLGISEGTVENHITEIFRALKASNRTQAAQLNSDAE
jgi:DNA-binding NarL/FixJ family response regulator